MPSLGAPIDHSSLTAAHIRKTRPRFDFGQDEPDHHIIRAGIPYGPEGIRPRSTFWLNLLNYSLQLLITSIRRTHQVLILLWNEALLSVRLDDDYIHKSEANRNDSASRLSVQYQHWVPLLTTSLGE